MNWIHTVISVFVAFIVIVLIFTSISDYSRVLSVSSWQAEIDTVDKEYITYDETDFPFKVLFQWTNCKAVHESEYLENKPIIRLYWKFDKKDDEEKPREITFKSKCQDNTHTKEENQLLQARVTWDESFD